MLGNDSEGKKMEKAERKALAESIIGKEYVYNFTSRKSCSKSKIKYLGIVRLKNGKQYKILTSFFVYSTGVDMCHGTSNIGIYNLKNQYIGHYYVGSPDNLPDYLKGNKLRYLGNSNGCNLRNTRIIDLSKGLPKEFFIPCTKDGGDIYSFSKGK
jgi:hypothetical protein